ncbi:uncharacterized protein UHOD_00428 [Ustilago sp. UG-2017b]|nr:uncharacterized protein UHOD_00428 [Ustilago sp. UG-2017b]
MSKPYYPQQPRRQPAYENPLHQQQSQYTYSSRDGGRYPSYRPPQPQSHPLEMVSSSSHTGMLPASTSTDGIDYHHYHSAPTPYHDPYAALTAHNDRLRPSLSKEHLVNPSFHSKDLAQSTSDINYDATLGAGAGYTHYTLSKDSDTGRIGFGRGHRIEATDGLLPDTAPDMDRLNRQQKEIMKQFPPDLDAPGGGKSGLQAAKDLLKDYKSWFKFKYLHWWLMLVVVIAIVALTTIYHKQIVDWLTPISRKVTTVAWGWIVPVAILFIISFPPLFGHEIVLILVGLVYGIWIGFGIASLGTLLGEIGNFYAFKHCLRSTAARYERKNIHYACMAEMVRDGGFWVMFLARLSAIPGHFTTAVFATVGMNVFIFTLAAVLALPKQLLIVYLGVAIKNSGDGKEDMKSKIIKYVVLVVSFIITLWTAYWLYQRMEKIRPAVSGKLRQKRYELLLQARTPGTEAYSGPREWEQQHEHAYPPSSVDGGGTGVDASYAYRQPQQPRTDEMYNRRGGPQPGDYSTESYDPPHPTPPVGLLQHHRQPIFQPQQGRISYEPDLTRTLPQVQGRQAITAPMQFHRPLPRKNTASPPTSPFRDPPSDGFTHPHPPPQRREEGLELESVPLTNTQGEWASNSSLAPSPVEGPPPEYASFPPSSHGHTQVQNSWNSVAAIEGARADAGVQRYHLSD